VHEDDALSLALTCRPLRDALWVRFPQRLVPVPVGGSIRHGGGRSSWVAPPVGGTANSWRLERTCLLPGTPPRVYRLRTGGAAVVATLARAQWVAFELVSFELDSPGIRGVIKSAALHGNLAVLEWAMAAVELSDWEECYRDDICSQVGCSTSPGRCLFDVWALSPYFLSYQRCVHAIPPHESLLARSSM
jgi:hypothetical protein